MAKLDIICWLWGTKYSGTDVERLQKAVRRHLGTDHSFSVFTDRVTSNLPAAASVRMIPQEDRPLCDRSCWVRLRMFDPKWQQENNFKNTILSLDLDLVITGGPLDPLFELEPESNFRILGGVNAYNPNPFNGSLMLLRAGVHPEVWQEFSPEKAIRVPYHDFPDDQGWIWHMLPGARTWKAGTGGIYGFKKPGWPGGENLPGDAKIVAFVGRRKPSQFAYLKWVQKNWGLRAAV